MAFESAIASMCTLESRQCLKRNKGFPLQRNNKWFVRYGFYCFAAKIASIERPKGSISVSLQRLFLALWFAFRH